MPIALTTPFQRGVGLGEGLLGVVVRVVQQGDVHPVQAEAVQAGLQGAQDSVGAEVPDAAVGVGHGEALGEIVAAAVLRVGFEQPPDLGGDGVRVAVASAQHGAQAPLGQPESVVRGGVEGAYARLPGRLHRGGRGLLGDRAEEVADAGGPERQLGDPDTGAAQRGRSHAPTAGRSRSPCMPPSTARAMPVTEAAAGLAR
jgi:hypothetical protein